MNCKKIKLSFPNLQTRFVVFKNEVYFCTNLQGTGRLISSIFLLLPMLHLTEEFEKWKNFFLLLEISKKLKCVTTSMFRITRNNSIKMYFITEGTFLYF